MAFGPQEKYEKRLGYPVAAFEVCGYKARDEDVCVIYEQPGRQIGRFALHADRTHFLFVVACDFGPWFVSAHGRRPKNLYPTGVRKR